MDFYACYYDTDYIRGDIQGPVAQLPAEGEILWRILAYWAVLEPLDIQVALLFEYRKARIVLISWDHPSAKVLDNEPSV